MMMILVVFVHKLGIWGNLAGGCFISSFVVIKVLGLMNFRCC